MVETLLVDILSRRCLHPDVREGLQDPLLSPLVQFEDGVNDGLPAQRDFGVRDNAIRLEHNLRALQSRDCVLLRRGHIADHNHLEFRRDLLFVRDEQAAPTVTFPPPPFQARRGGTMPLPALNGAAWHIAAS